MDSNHVARLNAQRVNRGQDVKELLEGVQIETLSHYKYTKLFQYGKNKLLTIRYLHPKECIFTSNSKYK